MNKKLFILIIFILSLVLFGCENGKTKNERGEQILINEANATFSFFWETSNSDENSPGYGFSLDRYPNNPSLSSIASTGFMLAALPYGVEKGFISFNAGYKRALGTLNSMLEVEEVEGFLPHFVNIKTAVRSPGSEISIIDTALFLAGAIVAGEYFQADVLTTADILYERINWPFYLNKARNLFYMGYRFEEGFSGAWDHISEQLLLYVLAAGSESYPLDETVYQTVRDISLRDYRGKYRSSILNKETEEFIYTYNGSLFQHQFSHAFIDFRDKSDEKGINWFLNAKEATLANYYYSKDLSLRYKSFLDGWGLSASDGPTGYLAFGSKPAKNFTQNGTIATYASLASINYLYQEVIDAALYLDTLKDLKGDYGFKDAFNLGPFDNSYNSVIAELSPWYASDYVGIDKGITLLMWANFENELIWNLFMNNEKVQKGLEVLMIF